MRTKNDPVKKNSLWRLTLAMPLILLASPGCQQTADEPNPHEAEVVDGRAAYEAYCASCHGLDAKGNGPVAPALKTVPPDLTQLKKNFDGVYPSEYVLRTIDGRHQFVSHGTRQMPIWGNIWREDSTDHDVEVEAQRRMNFLLHYLETIQEEPLPEE